MNDVSRANETGIAPGFTTVAEIAVQRGAVSGIAVSPEDTWLMVIHHGDDSFSLIDTADSALCHTVIDVDKPSAIAISHIPTDRAYVSTSAAAFDSILAFDIEANQVVATYPVAHTVTDLVVGPDGRTVYASRTAPNGADVAILDTTTGEEDAVGIAATVGTATQCVRVSPDGRQLYVAVNGPFAAQFVVIDTHARRVVNTIEIASPIRDIALGPDAGTAYIGSCGPDFGAVIDVVDNRTGTVGNTYKISEIAGGLLQLALSRDGERAYLVGDQDVTVLSTATLDVVGSIATGSQPSCVTESPDGNRVYIADYAGAITVLTHQSTTASGDAVNPDQMCTAPHQWAFADRLGLEPTLV